MDDYVTTQEAARIKGVGVETIRRWIKAGTLDAVKVGVSYLVKRSDLDRIMVSNKGRPMLREMIRRIVKEELESRGETARGN